MNKPNDGLSLLQKYWIRRALKDPVLFAEHFLGVSLSECEVEILRSIKKHRRTAIKVAHGLGKTFTLAVVTLWWLARYSEGIVLTTSPTQRQVETVLWAEINRLIDRAKVPYPKHHMSRLKFRDDSNFAMGFSTNQSTHFQGYHGQQVLIIADEAPGIESSVFDAIAGIMAGGKVHVVMAGNPTIPSGPFFDAFTNERGLWNCITVSAFDSPNLKGLSLEQLMQLDSAEGGPLDQNPVPYLVTRRWVYEQYQAWWHGSESSSPKWVSRVLAKFPDQAENALFNMSWLERAKRRPLSADAAGSVPLVAGVDVGGGQAETVVYVCEATYGRPKVIAMGAWRGKDTRGQVVKFLNQFRARLAIVRVDASGIGHTFGLHLRDENFRVEMVYVGLPCESLPHRGENDPTKRFVNQRACYYQGLADVLERDQIEGLVDETTIGQLAGVLYELDSHGRMKIESKETARARGIASPDRADALMLALCKPYQKFEFHSISELEQRRAKSTVQASRANHPFFGFADLGDDDGDDERDAWAGFAGKLRLPRGRVCW